LVSRFGQFYKSVDPGLVKVNVCSEQIRVVGKYHPSERTWEVSEADGIDVKIQLTGVPRQMVQTKDNVSVDVDSVICWHVISPYRAAFGINDVRTALVERARKSHRGYCTA
jgi:erythrocyte band 7 integral membrane protein